tara:strand:+ start:707 stop:1297 length:591 start_codon:yes stop_codon:yes gene_type:complete
MSRIPASGAMTWNDIQNSFGGSNPIGINEYYRNSTYVPTSNLNANIPTSGQIEATDFRGADGFSGTTGSFDAGNSGGKLTSNGYDENSYGSNLGTAFTTGSGVKCNVYQLAGLLTTNFSSTTVSPATATQSNLLNKVLTVSGAISYTQQMTQGSSSNTVPASFGGGSTGVFMNTAIGAPGGSGIPATSGVHNFSMS